MAGEVGVSDLEIWGTDARSVGTGIFYRPEKDLTVLQSGYCFRAKADSIGLSRVGEYGEWR
jgi:hypothetical protein